MIICDSAGKHKNQRTPANVSEHQLTYPCPSREPYSYHTRFPLDRKSAGGKQPTNHINESGLYALIFGSTKPEAKRFKRWVTSEVLPSIRKTGRYQIPQTAPSEPVRGLSYRECAKALGVGSTAIARWVRDGNIQPEPGGGVDLEKVREIGHQKWDKYGHHGYKYKCGLPRPGITPISSVRTGTYANTVINPTIADALAQFMMRDILNNSPKEMHAEIEGMKGFMAHNISEISDTVRQFVMAKNRLNRLAGNVPLAKSASRKETIA